MGKMNYKIEAIEICLNPDCILKQYHPLIPFKGKLLNALKRLGCETKTDCSALTDEDLIRSGALDRDGI